MNSYLRIQNLQKEQGVMRKSRFRPLVLLYLLVVCYGLYELHAKFGLELGFLMHAIIVVGLGAVVILMLFVAGRKRRTNNEKKE